MFQQKNKYTKLIFFQFGYQNNHINELNFNDEKFEILLNPEFCLMIII